MNGTGVPLVTPFTEDGDIDHDSLIELVDWTTERGVDFIVPTGSTSESELLTVDERTEVIETVVEAAPEGVDVLAGTGHPGYRETIQQTQAAAEVGADAALVVTPFYYSHDDATLASYYRKVADESDIPIYLYSVPVFTHVTLSPGVVDDLAGHPNIHGMKDSSGDVAAFQQIRGYTEDEDFEYFVGLGSVYAATLDAGGDGGVVGVANILPERANEIYELHRAGKDQAARDLNRRLLELIGTAIGEHGMPGVKAAMRARGAPAGYPRSPHQPVSDEAREEIERLVEAALP